MKTHEMARYLIMLGNMLKRGPNVEMNESDSLSVGSSFNDEVRLSAEEIPHTLHLLIGLNQVSKNQWLDLVEEFGFDVDIRPRDANRDILGKLLKYFGERPDEREKLIGKKGKKPISGSADLAAALTLLLK